MSHPSLQKRSSSLWSEEISRQISFTHQARGSKELCKEEEIDIVRVYYGLLRDKLVTCAQKITACLLGRSSRTVSSVLREWNISNTDETGTRNIFSTNIGRGNTKSKRTRIPNTLACKRIVRDFARMKRMNAEHVTARQVLDHLIDRRIVTWSKTRDGSPKKSDLESAYRSVRRFLNCNGFCRGRRKDGISINYKHVVWRNRYLRVLRENRNKPESERLKEVYLDESYIHKHHSHDANSLYYPSDANYVQPKLKRKGRRYCICAAIRGNGQ